MVESSHRDCLFLQDKVRCSMTPLFGHLLPQSLVDIPSRLEYNRKLGGMFGHFHHGKDGSSPAKAVQKKFYENLISASFFLQ